MSEALGHGVTLGVVVYEWGTRTWCDLRSGGI